MTEVQVGAPVASPTPGSDVRNWKGLLVLGAWAALASVALIVIQIVVYVVWPPPETTVEFYDLRA